MIRNTTRNTMNQPMASKIFEMVDIKNESWINRTNVPASPMTTAIANVT